MYLFRYISHSGIVKYGFSTIVFVVGDVERDCDSRSTISSHMSDNERQNFPSEGFGNLFQNEPNQESNCEDSVRDHLNERLKVWKLQDIPFDNTGTVGSLGSPLSAINTFTLQETLFIEQLTSIDERVRVQVVITSLSLFNIYS